jgi:hypothetical protein
MPEPRTDTDRIEFLRLYGIVPLLAYRKEISGLGIRDAIDLIEALVTAGETRLERLKVSRRLRRPAVCKYGDPFCPCPDGDMCHYEGPGAWKPPQTGDVDA